METEMKSHVYCILKSSSHRPSWVQPHYFNIKYLYLCGKLCFFILLTTHISFSHISLLHWCWKVCIWELWRVNFILGNLLFSHMWALCGRSYISSWKWQLSCCGVFCTAPSLGALPRTSNCSGSVMPTFSKLGSSVHRISFMHLCWKISLNTQGRHSLRLFSECSCI
jgi:hypothetical protein